MAKEKFDRSKPHVNIGEIGRNNITHNNYARAIELFQYFEEEARKKNEQLLNDLVDKYGLEVGYEKYLELMEERRKDNSIYFGDNKPKSRKK